MLLKANFDGKVISNVTKVNSYYQLLKTYSQRTPNSLQTHWKLTPNFLQTFSYFLQSY